MLSAFRLRNGPENRGTRMRRQYTQIQDLRDLQDQDREVIFLRRSVGETLDIG